MLGSFVSKRSQRLHTPNPSRLLARCHSHSELAHTNTSSLKHYIRQARQPLSPLPPYYSLPLFSLLRHYQPRSTPNRNATHHYRSYTQPPSPTPHLQVFQTRRNHHISTTSSNLLPAISTQSPHPRTMGHRPCPSSIYTRHEQFSRSNTHRQLWTRLRRLRQRTIHYLLQSNPISLFATHLLHHQPL